MMTKISETQWNQKKNHLHSDNKRQTQRNWSRQMIVCKEICKFSRKWTKKCIKIKSWPTPNLQSCQRERSQAAASTQMSSQIWTETNQSYLMMIFRVLISQHQTNQIQTSMVHATNIQHLKSKALSRKNRFRKKWILETFHTQNYWELTKIFNFRIKLSNSKFKLCKWIWNKKTTKFKIWD